MMRETDGVWGHEGTGQGGSRPGTDGGGAVASRELRIEYDDAPPADAPGPARHA
ncbi:hypothetical protein ACLESO_54070 [Pyxidicoccus sp. 3LG]